MIIAALDFETTGVDTETCYPTEFAIILWNPCLNQILDSLSFLIAVPKEVSIDNAWISGIDRALIDSYGIEWSEYHKDVLTKLRYAHHFMAHNVEFDKPILKRMLGGDYKMLQFTDSQWIDTMTDIPYPRHIRSRGLVHLAAEHGFLNPFPHRALFDVATTIKLAGMYDIDEIIRLSSSPNIWIRAIVTKEDRFKAKEQHFQWDPVNTFWVKRIKEAHLEQAEKDFDFPIDILNGYSYKEAYT